MGSEYVSDYRLWKCLCFFCYFLQFESIKFRSSRWQMSFEVEISKYFAIFTRKHLCWSVFVIKLPDCKPENLLKRDSNTRVFLLILLNLKSFLRTAFFIEHLQWLHFKAMSETVRTSLWRTKKAFNKLFWLLYW